MTHVNNKNIFICSSQLLEDARIHFDYLIGERVVQHEAPGHEHIVPVADKLFLKGSDATWIGVTGMRVGKIVLLAISNSSQFTE